MTQRQINAAFKCSLKPTYVGLSNLEYRLIKKQERFEQLDKAVDQTYYRAWKRYGEGFRKHPDFQNDFELIGEWETEKEKILNSIRRMEEKYGIDRDDVIRKPY
jgi:hypothetical protein